MIHKYHFILIIVISYSLLLSNQYLHATPASKDTLIVTQGGPSDFSGNQITLTLHGDEEISWYTNASNYVVGKDTNGQWKYLTADSNGFTFSGNDALGGTPNTISSGNLPTQSYFRNIRALKNKAHFKTTSSSNVFNQLVILASFSDHWNTADNTVNSANSKNITRDAYTSNVINNISQYFSPIIINTTLTHWIKLPHPESYYGQDNLNTKDFKVESMVQDALTIIATSNTSITGVVLTGNTINNITYDSVMVVHSGNEQSNTLLSTSANNLWARTSALSSPISIFGGNIVFNKYSTVAALGGSDGTQSTDIGLYCHELGHLLGLPDLYSYTEGYFSGSYDIMGFGGWGITGNATSSNSPSGFSAYSQVKLGIKTATEISGAGNNIELPQNSLQKISNLSSSNEYFLIENPTGTGMLIWHVYENAFSDNVNNLIHPIVKLEEADNNDSLGVMTALQESGDFWNNSNNLSTFTYNSSVSGNSSSNFYENSSYYNRPLGTNKSNIDLSSFSISGTKVLFNIRGFKTSVFFADPANDFNTGKISWYKVPNASSYAIYRSTSDGVFTLLNTQTENSYIDKAFIDNNLDNGVFYAIRSDLNTTQSDTFQFGLKIYSSSLNLESRDLTLFFNTDIDIEYTTSISLNLVSLYSNTGIELFKLNENPVSDITITSSQENTVKTNSGASTKNLTLSLTPTQIYKITSTLGVNPGIMNIKASQGAFFLSGTSITNINQSNSGVSTSTTPDTNSPVFQYSTHDNDTGITQLIYNEVIIQNSTDLSQFTFENSDGLSTDLTGGSVSISDNVISINIPNKTHLRTLIIGNNKTLNLLMPSGSFKDLSSNSPSGNGTNLATFTFSPKIILDQKPPSISNYTINNRDEIRTITLNFSEPIFSDTSRGASFSKDNFHLTFYHAGNITTNGTDILGESISLNQSADTFGGFTYIVTSGVNISIGLDDANKIDQKLGYFDFPAPAAYAGVSSTSIGFYDWEGNRANNTAVKAQQYIPKKRLWLTNPTQYERWRGQHLVTWDINGGWLETDRINVEWWNIQNTTKAIANDFVFITSEPGVFFQTQLLIWDTTKELDNDNYHIRVFESGDYNVVYSSSATFQIDNTKPDVEISYLSPITPTNRPNAIDTYTNAALPVDNSEKANIVIVATFSENVIDTPLIKINQKGETDIHNSDNALIGVPMTTTAGSLNQFFYPYDVSTQDGKSFLDGEAVIEITSVPDTAKGDIRLSTNPSDLLGNLSNPPTSNTTFLIDTIAPTIASLNFSITDESIGFERTSLLLNFSESMYDASLPATGVLLIDNYSFRGARSDNLTLASIERLSDSGTGPYKLVLNGQILQGTIQIVLNIQKIKDFHGNEMGNPSTADATWPGPLTNLTPVIISPGGKTRLLIQGGFLPYRYNINPIYSSIASIDPKDNTSILAHQFGQFTIEIIEARNQIRYINTEVQPPVQNNFTKKFSAYRDELDYNLTSFPFNFPEFDGEHLFETLKASAGVHNKEYALYSYDSNKEGYFLVTKKTTEVGPGYGFWMASRKSRTITQTKDGPLEKQVIGIDLHPGWNLVGNPFNSPLPIENIFVSTNASRFNITDIKQSETGHHLWYIDINNPRYLSIETLKPNSAAWLYVSNNLGAEIFFFKEKENVLLPQDYLPLENLNKVSKSLRSTTGEPIPPTRPSSRLFNSRSSGSGSAAGGGCFIQGILNE